MKLKSTLNLVLLIVFSVTATVHAETTDRLMKKAGRYFEAMPAQMPGAEHDSAVKIQLGKKLFFDPRLSINDKQSCSSCHRLEKGFAGIDNLPTSPGAKGQIGTRNSPTVFNSGFQSSQFWDGRAENLVEQAKGPILNPIEMGMPNEKAVVAKLSAIADYQTAFKKAFPKVKQALTYQNIAEAIAAFERTLITPSRFDDYLNGSITALNDQEKRGLATFIKLDCVSCHDGILLGGTSFEKMGKENPYSNQADPGVYQVSKDEDDRMVFKVSPLRNVALTAPYFHDGKVASLEEAVRLMARLQLNQELKKEQLSDVVSFLKSLSAKDLARFQK
jgi:cytochrome c peroxidase